MPDPAAALACQRNMRHWHLARVEAGGGEVVREGGLVWGFVADGLKPPGAGRIVPFPEGADGTALAALATYFAARAAVPWCTLGAPLSPPALRPALKRAGFHYAFPALCMARRSDAPAAGPREPDGCEIREVHDLDLPERAVHPSYGPLSEPAARASLRAATALTKGNPPVERMLCAFDGDRLVGSVSVHHDGESTGIYDLATLPDHRRRGIAGRLLAEAIRLAQDSRPRWIVLQNDVSLARFYGRFGFETVATLEHWLLEPAAQAIGSRQEGADTAIEDLATAAILDQPERVAHLLATRPDLVGATVPGAEASALHLAAYHGSVRSVAALAQARAALDARDARHGSTPLAWAMHGLSEGGPAFKRDQAGAAEALLAAGARFGEAEREAARRLDGDMAARIAEAAKRHGDA